jgi:RimJ/RimL family protein N-acetyltransferase
MKSLLIEHVLSKDSRRTEFKVDLRNSRSQREVRKLGARHDGVLRENKITWIGYVRDTELISLFQAELLAAATVDD